MKWGEERRLELLASPEPHPVRPYHCACTACEAWRAVRVSLGSFVMPATHDPKKTSPGTTPAWEHGAWRETGWNFRLENNHITHGTVIGFIDKDDRSNGGHLDCVIVLWNDNKIRVTSRMWLTTG